ncbi:MAG TPA: pantoate--beta-alanine ligase [Ferruginibacter sp.]|mgnify:FL=1|nr:pantoate--beta-alanine ligase [Ferruginibacter sp.]HRO05702.1 pantoate--beta-alanine ligase [Ferruginibacter sp.]HRO95873.1 pantoate--beta-alanine ligase [Ferruginibacter sp.]HRP49118.1 pantoate--beta-alanine ligase [Ferruginibacter sp.]
MKIFKTAEALHTERIKLSNRHISVGFVPTMGALHNGHITLVQQAKNSKPYVITSIFVNPTQFNNVQDFELYPISVEDDLNQLEAAGCDAVFLPSVEEIYPPGYVAPDYPIGYLETVLEGAYRPGHFQGVCQVVDRLLQIVQPNEMLLGRKDFQQCKVLEKMVELKQYPVQLTFVPTLRETDGLAMSSRNRRLTPEQRRLAPLLYQSLISIKNKIETNGTSDIIINEIKNLEQSEFKVDYLQLARANDLQPLQQWNGENAVLLVAAYLDNIRLIDNIEIAAKSA